MLPADYARSSLTATPWVDDVGTRLELVLRRGSLLRDGDLLDIHGKKRKLDRLGCPTRCRRTFRGSSLEKSHAADIGRAERAVCCALSLSRRRHFMRAV